MNREITSHKVNGLNEALRIEVLDEPGPGGANHEYRISFIDPDPPREATDYSEPMPCAAEERAILINFQKGGIIESGGVNGISNEVLLAIVEDRLKCFQAGQFACRENALALTHLQDAMHWLHHRTRERMARGVEGVSVK